MNLLKTKTIPLLLSAFLLVPSNSHAGPGDDPELLYQVAATAVVLVAGVASALYCMCAKAVRRPTPSPFAAPVFVGSGSSEGVMLRPVAPPVPVHPAPTDEVSGDDEGNSPLEPAPVVNEALLRTVAELRKAALELADVARVEHQLNETTSRRLARCIQRITNFDIRNEPIADLAKNIGKLARFADRLLEDGNPGKSQKRLLDAASALALAMKKLAAELAESGGAFASEAVAIQKMIDDSRARADKKQAEQEKEAQRKRDLEEQLAKQRQAAARTQRLQEQAAREQERAAETRRYNEERARQAREQAAREREERAAQTRRDDEERARKAREAARRQQQEERARQQEEVARRQRAEEERQRQIQEAKLREERLRVEAAERSARETAEARRREAQLQGVAPMRVGYGVTLEDLEAAKEKHSKK